ncbi:MAG TPA: hypothetical protein VEK79_03755 [Thermoanaerobaculia bacterium]|nr:hypothetical protein [Thermoanaerobaculia bacterium]
MTIEGTDEITAKAYSLKRRLASLMYGEDSVAAAMEGDEERSYLAAIPLWSNIVGFGYGPKWTSNNVTSMNAVRVYVRAKLARFDVPQQERIPDEIDGVPTDIIPVGEITAAFPRPVSGGASGGHRDTNGGTLGCLVDQNGAGRFILSNNHVLANVNRGVIGDPILEPGRARGGAANPPIARLSAFAALSLNGGKNEIDAAIAELIDAAEMTPDISGIGRVNPPPLAPVTTMSVRKSGAVTAHTLGTIQDVAADIRVMYPGVGFADFERQIAIAGSAGPFADRGDSGSLVVDVAQTRPVGLLFAVSATMTFCNHASTVLAAFNSRVL